MTGSAAEPIPNFRGKEQDERGGRKKREEKSTTTMREKGEENDLPGARPGPGKRKGSPVKKRKMKRK